VNGERGQASVELLGAVPALLLLGLVLFQLLAVGYSAVLAGNAAEAGALAVATGADPREAARAAVPRWQRARMAVRANDGRVEVSMRPPALLDRLERALAISAVAEVEAP
jgi:Flp pilus assembly protein TadG